MKIKKVSEEIIGNKTIKDIFSEQNHLLVKKDTFLKEEHISLLKNHNIFSVPVQEFEIEKELYFQIESFIPKSNQPLFWESYLDLLQDTKNFFYCVSHDVYFVPKHITKKMHEMLTFLTDEKEFLFFNYSIKGEEDSLYRHSINVGVLSYILGKESYSIEDPFLLAKMGYFHDIGKLKINQEVLTKEGPLSEEEKNHIETHTVLGAEIIRKLHISNKEIQQAALLHHESRLGNGYPYGYNKENIPYSVQIITTADMLDSICSDRVYKKRKTLLQGLNELYFETVKGRLNPLISFPLIEKVIAFCENHPVRLSNGETGTIFHINDKEIIRPILELKSGRFIDLSKQRNIFLDDIVE